jgi:hypothetical protein
MKSKIGISNLFLTAILILLVGCEDKRVLLIVVPNHYSETLQLMCGCKGAEALPRTDELYYFKPDNSYELFKTSTEFYMDQQVGVFEPDGDSVSSGKKIKSIGQVYYDYSFREIDSGGCHGIITLTVLERN